MGKWPSKLRNKKIKDNTNILLTHLYLPKLYKNILKLQTKFIKKNNIQQTASRWLRNLLQAFPTVCLFKLVNAAVVEFFALSLDWFPNTLKSSYWVFHVNGNQNCMLLPNLWLVQSVGAAEYTDWISAEG